MQRRDFRNSTAPWFGRYAERTLFKKLGYTSNMNEMRADEAEWFKAIDIAFTDASKALQAVASARGKG